MMKVLIETIEQCKWKKEKKSALHGFENIYIKLSCAGAQCSSTGRQSFFREFIL
jgi:hypothetical protein